MCASQAVKRNVAKFKRFEIFFLLRATRHAQQMVVTTNHTREHIVAHTFEAYSFTHDRSMYLTKSNINSLFETSIGN